MTDQKEIVLNKEDNSDSVFYMCPILSRRIFIYGTYYKQYGVYSPVSGSVSVSDTDREVKKWYKMSEKLDRSARKRWWQFWR